MWRCACVLTVLCTALLRCDAIKRAEMSPVPFVLSSRYGRSPPRMLMPRSDRSELFFIGSRYGKRSQTGAGSVGGAAGLEGARWRGACNCAQYGRHPNRQTDGLYKRYAGAPERVSTED